jgi:hypothetical protein
MPDVPFALAAVVISALSAVIVTMAGAIVFLFMRLEAVRSKYSLEVRTNAPIVKQLEHMMKEKAGLHSVPPAPVEDWNEDTINSERAGREARRQIELAKLLTSYTEKTPERNKRR